MPTSEPDLITLATTGSITPADFADAFGYPLGEATTHLAKQHHEAVLALQRLQLTLEAVEAAGWDEPFVLARQRIDAACAALYDAQTALHRRGAAASPGEKSNHTGHLEAWVNRMWPDITSTEG